MGLFNELKLLCDGYNIVMVVYFLNGFYLYVVFGIGN